MKPINFKETNRIIAKNQPEYLPLPAYVTEEGKAISCWKLTPWERLQILFKGKLWISILTFNKPLQPLLPSIKSPIIHK